MFNKLIQWMVRKYPFEKGYYRIAKMMDKLIVPVVTELPDLHGKFRFKIDLSSGSLQRGHFLFFTKNYELPTQNYLKKTIKPGMVVMDIGAHVGFFTLLLADLVGNKGKVYSFEPYSKNVQLLRENVVINNLDWVEVIPLALSDKVGEVILHLNPINDGGHSLADLSNNPDLRGWDTHNLIEVVRTTTLDNFVQEKGIQKIDLIKMDVEGAETLVLEGAKNTLSMGKVSKIISETGTQAQKQMSKTEKDLRDIFYAYNFHSYFIDEQLTEFGPEIPVEKLSNILYLKKTS